MPEINLRTNQNWKSIFPELGFTTKLSVKYSDKDARSIVSISQTEYCRESLIVNTQAVLQNKLTNALEASEASWNDKGRVKKAVRGKVDLSKSPQGSTSLRIQWSPRHQLHDTDYPVKRFLDVCDRVLGPICVLLSPKRKTGDWWKTDPDKAIRIVGDYNHVCWSGSDSWFLQHPATMAIATGMYRQCLQLCAAGAAEEIIKRISTKRVEEALSTCSQIKCLRIANALRDVIEVPPARDGGISDNLAFPKETWKRLIVLQRAIRKVGYEKALNQTFSAGWNLVTDRDVYDGLHGFWGLPGKETDFYQHLMTMGARKAV